MTLIIHRVRHRVSWARKEARHGRERQKARPALSECGGGRRGGVSGDSGRGLLTESDIGAKADQILVA